MLSDSNGITVVLPWPDKALSPNARVDRRAKAPIVAEHRSAASAVTSTLIHEDYKPDGVDVYITFHPPDNRRRDLDNCYAMCKAYQDGIFQALGMDDRLIRMVTLRFGKVRARGEVLINISDPDRMMWM